MYDLDAKIFNLILLTMTHRHSLQKPHEKSYVPAQYTYNVVVYE